METIVSPQERKASEVVGEILILSEQLKSGHKIKYDVSALGHGTVELIRQRLVDLRFYVSVRDDFIEVQP